jgi:hypothetical protein
VSFSVAECLEVSQNVAKRRVIFVMTSCSGRAKSLYASGLHAFLRVLFG